MPMVLIRGQVNKAPDGRWYFGFKRTRLGSDILEVGTQDLSNDTVVQIYRDTVGVEPATGLEADNLLTHWESLEPHLRAEIQNLVGA